MNHAYRVGLLLGLISSLCQAAEPDSALIPMSPSSEFVCLNRVVGSPSCPPHMGDTNSLDGDTEDQFARRWAGFATAKVPYQMKQGGRYFQFVERTGERSDDWRYQGFLSTTDRDEVDALTVEFPKRWQRQVRLTVKGSGRS